MRFAPGFAEFQKEFIMPCIFSAISPSWYFKWNRICVFTLLRCTSAYHVKIHRLMSQLEVNYRSYRIIMLQINCREFWSLTVGLLNTAFFGIHVNQWNHGQGLGFFQHTDTSKDWRSCHNGFIDTQMLLCAADSITAGCAPVSILHEGL